MVPYYVAELVFYVLLTVSTVLTAFLLILYVRQSQNLILQSCCIVVLVNSALLYLKLFASAFISWEMYWLKVVQAFGLNFCMIAIQSHMTAMMFNSCAQALRWTRFQASRRKNPTGVLLYLTLSYLAAFIPTIMVIVFDAAGYSRFLLSSTFFSVLTEPALGTHLAAALVSIPGMICALILLHRTSRLREMTLLLSRHSGISPFYLFRINLATFLYILIGMASFAPSIVSERDSTQFLSHAERRPRYDDFIPSLIGTMLFIIFGFGSPARKSYREMFGWKSRRRGASFTGTVDLEAPPPSTTRPVIHQSFLVLSEPGDRQHVTEEEMLDLETAIIGIEPPGEEPELPKYRSWSLSKTPPRRNSEPTILAPRPLPPRMTVPSPITEESIDSGSSGYDVV
jgi:hypothetical protein